MTNNQLSRQVLALLIARGSSIRFADLVKELKVDARAVFKNLFFLEEKGLVQLSTSYPVDAAVYPIIHLVKLRPAGEELARDPAGIEETFPLDDQTTDTQLHIPDTYGARSITFHQVLEVLSRRVKRELKDQERDKVIESIKALMELPLAKQKL
jgi:hypothetical protein